MSNLNPPADGQKLQIPWARPLKSKVLFVLFITLIYFGIASLFTYPLITNLDKGIYGYKGDNMLYIHDIWVWSKNNNVDLGEIKYSKISTQPILDKSAVLLAKAVDSPLLSYNILILFSFVSTGVLTFLAAFKITKNYLAAFFAGLIFSFSPYHLRHSQNHLEIAQIEVVPFYFLYLYNFAKSLTRKRAFVAGLALAITTLTVNYYGFFLGILTAVYILYNEISKRFRGFKKRLLSYLILAFTAVGLTIGCNVNYIKIASQNKNLDEYTWKAIGKTDLDYIKYAAKPWLYILPDIENPAMGQFSKNILIKIAQNTPYYLTREFTANEHTLYLGLASIFLSIIALKFKPKTAKRLLLLAIIFVLISLPPYIFISMKKVILPSFFLMKIFPMFRVYARAGVITLFLVSLSSAIGLAILTSNHRKKLRTLLVTLTVGVLVISEFYTVPKFEKLLPLPPEYSSTKIANAKTILESPKLEDHTNAFYQIYHQKPVYFIRINSRNRIDENDLEAQINLREKPMAIIFRGSYQQIFSDHKLNEMGIDLQSGKKHEWDGFSQEHISWLNENGDIIRNRRDNEKILEYGETLLFFHNK